MENTAPSSSSKLRVRDGSERQVRFKSTVGVLGAVVEGSTRYRKPVERNLIQEQKKRHPRRKHLSWAGGCSRRFQRSKTVYVKADHTERSQTSHLVVFECI